VQADDGVRLWVGDRLIVDAWDPPLRGEARRSASLDAGVHRLRLEYYDATGDASVSLTWMPLAVYLPVLLCDYRAPCDLYEPNDDRRVDPWGPLASGVTYRARLCTGDEEDNYYLDATGEGELSVQLTVPSTLVGHTAIWAYGPSDLETPICGEAPVQGSETTLSCGADTPGRYVLRLYTDGVTDDTSPYTLQATFP